MKGGLLKNVACMRSTGRIGQQYDRGMPGGHAVFRHGSLLVCVQSGGIIGSAKQALGYGTPTEQRQTTTVSGATDATQVLPS